MGGTGGNSGQKNILVTTFGVLSAAQEKPVRMRKNQENKWVLAELPI